MVGSESVKKLKQALGGKIIKLTGSTYRYKPHHNLINWGNSRLPDWNTPQTQWLNHPDNVALTTDKIKTFNRLQEQGVRTVPFTTDKAEAQGWLNHGEKVFVRETTTGHSGAGIAVVEPENNNTQELRPIAERLYALGFHALGDVVAGTVHNPNQPELPDAPLYTKGVANGGEYRVHIFMGEVLLYQKKSRRVDEDGNVITAEGEEADVRNLASNWVYRTGDLRRLDRVIDAAQASITALGLDFGAVDILLEEGTGLPFVLEVNSAPGLGNTETLEMYRRAFMGEQITQEGEDEVEDDVWDDEDDDVAENDEWWL